MFFSRITSLLQCRVCHPGTTCFFCCPKNKSAAPLHCNPYSSIVIGNTLLSATASRSGGISQRIRCRPWANVDLRFHHCYSNGHHFRTYSWSHHQKCFFGLGE